MLSDKKLAANRANAQHSTGPKTETGKQRVSQNALKHGLNAAQPLVRDDERETYNSFEAGLRAQLLPATPLEEDLFAKIVHASWNLRRLRQLEDALVLDYEDPFTHPEAERKMNSYSRHTARFERVHRNALRDLRQLQTDRALVMEATQSGPVALTALTDITKLLKQTRRTHRESPQSPSGDLENLQEILDDIAQGSKNAPSGASSSISPITDHAD